MSTLLGKVKGGVENTFSTVQGKVQLKNLLCHLRAQIRILEKEKASHIVGLGQALYGMHRSGNIDFEALQRLMRTIDDTEQRLLDKQKEVDACSAALYGDDHAATEATTSGSYTCSCGAQMPFFAKFCSGCGRPNPSQPGTGNGPQRGRAYSMPPALTH